MHRTILVATALLALTGCESYTGFADQAVMQGMTEQIDDSLKTRTYAAVDAMLEKAPELTSTRGPLVVGSVQDITDVNSSTPFGNVISEMVRSRLVQRGLNVTDLRVRSSVLLERTKGEMLLSRDKKALLPAPLTADLVTGTYAVAPSNVFVSLKIISANDARIIAAADFEAPQSHDVASLLRTGAPLLRTAF